MGLLYLYAIMFPIGLALLGFFLYQWHLINKAEKERQIERQQFKD